MTPGSYPATSPRHGDAPPSKFLSPDAKEALREIWMRVRAKLRALGYATFLGCLGIQLTAQRVTGVACAAVDVLLNLSFNICC